MQPLNIIDDYLTILENIPEGGMIYYLEFHSLLRGRKHQNTFFMTFNGGEKSVFHFFQDQILTIANRLLLLQSWEVQMLGFLFVKLFPPPYVILFLPYPASGFWPVPACANKDLATVSFKTAEQGPRSRGRKFLFGMPASWIDGPKLTPEGHNRINSHMLTWETIYHPEYEAWPYTMGLMHRYVDGQLRSPLVPTNYWPYEKMLVREFLVRHRHVKRSSRWPNIT